MTSQTSLGPPYGFAIRRKGNCLPGESLTKAGQGFVRCCPKDSTASDKNTGKCCPTEDNCESQIDDPPHCADEAWVLYENVDGGYFCCAQDLLGFTTAKGVGCGLKDDSTLSDAVWLTIKAPASNSTSSSSQTLSSSAESSLSTASSHSTASSNSAVSSDSSTSNGSTTPSGFTTSSSSTISSSSPTSSSSSKSSSSSSPNTGAIAGGVVGGCAGLAIILALLWYFMRRRRQKQPNQDTRPITEASMSQYQAVPHSQQPSELGSPSTQPSELAGKDYVSELPGHKHGIPVHELPENPRT